MEQNYEVGWKAVSTYEINLCAKSLVCPALMTTEV
jgi:hypothetical protein